MSSDSDPFSRYPKPSSPIYYQRTLLGRIVYNRRPHLYNWRAVLRIINTMEPPEQGLEDPDAGPAWENFIACWLQLTTMIVRLLLREGMNLVELMMKVLFPEGLGGAFGFIFDKLVMPGLKWMVDQVMAAAQDYEPSPFEPERYGDPLTMKPTKEEETYA